MNMIGRLHDRTPVFSDDPVIECDWYERSAKAGYPSAMYNLSICYELADGRPKDSDKMLHWRTMAAEHGYIDAMINMAYFDKEKGDNYRYWLRKAADHGSRYARVDLWMEGYKQDVPDITARDIVCVSVLILIFDEHFNACD